MGYGQYRLIAVNGKAVHTQSVSTGGVCEREYCLLSESRAGVVGSRMCAP